MPPNVEKPARPDVTWVVPGSVVIVTLPAQAGAEGRSALMHAKMLNLMGCLERCL